MVIYWIIFKKNKIKKAVLNWPGSIMVNLWKSRLNWPGSIMVNLWKSRSGVWDYDKIMKSVSKQTRKSNYNELNVKS